MSESLIYRIKPILGSTIEVKQIIAPATYMVDEKVVGMGYIRVLIPVKEKWYITISDYMDNWGSKFSKLLLNYYEDGKFGRCHSHYIDNEDLKKKGGSFTSYEEHEVIISLIDHFKQ